MKGLYHQKPGGPWWVRFTPAPGAAQVRVSLETKDESEAILKARSIISKAGTETRAAMESCDFEIKAYLHHKKHGGLSASTLSSRNYVLRAFVRDLKVSTPKAITRAAVASWLHKRTTANAHTAANYLHIIQYWTGWLMAEGKLVVDPAADLVAAKQKLRIRRTFLLPDQARALLDACEDPGLKFALYCGLHAGLRKLEIIEAIPSWFDLKAGLIHVGATPTFQPKDRDNRTIPLTEEFKTWLVDHYKLQSPFMLEPAVVHGKYRYRYDFRNAFGQLTARCKFPWLTFHDTRRTFASLHASSGTSIYKIARWLGDDVDVVTEHYGHLIPQDAEINKAWTQDPPAKKKAKAKGRA